MVPKTRLASPLKATALDVSGAKVLKILEIQSILTGKLKNQGGVCPNRHQQPVRQQRGVSFEPN